MVGSANIILEMQSRMVEMDLYFTYMVEMFNQIDMKEFFEKKFEEQNYICAAKDCNNKISSSNYALGIDGKLYCTKYYISKNNKGV